MAIRPLFAAALLFVVAAGYASEKAPEQPVGVEEALQKASALEEEGRWAESAELLMPYRNLAHPQVDYALAHALWIAAVDGRSVEELVRAELGEALKLAERAAAARHGGALNMLHLIYANGHGVPVDEARAQDYLLRAFEAGDAGAKLNYAVMLFWGNPLVPRDVDRSCRIFLELADQEGASSFSAYYLGLATLRGECDQPRDPAKGIELIRRAAEGGVREAERDYARALQQGFGVPRDPEAAVAWMEKAADHGDAEALWHLGMVYVKGQVRPEDPERAVHYFRRARDAGSVDAMVSLAVMYATGSGIEHDYGEALALYRQATEAGAAHAYRNLAVMHMLGQGTDRDHGEAWLSYAKGLSLGNDPDPALASAIEAGLTRSQRADADAKLADWQRARERSKGTKP